MYNQFCIAFYVGDTPSTYLLLFHERHSFHQIHLIQVFLSEEHFTRTSLLPSSCAFERFHSARYLKFHASPWITKDKKRALKPHNFCRPSNRSQSAHVDKPLGISNLFPHPPLPGIFLWRKSTKQLATGSLKHQTGGNKVPPSHRSNSFYYIIVIRIGIRPFCCKQRITL